MMNDEMQQFEARLRRQPPKEIPAAWRTEILAVAHAVQVARRPSHGLNRSWLATFNDRLATIFWPHPKAWAGLAAIWVFILVLNVSIRDRSPVRAEKALPPSPEVIVELRKQQLLFAELLGPREEPVADRSKTYVPHPRSGRAKWLVG